LIERFEERFVVVIGRREDEECVGRQTVELFADLGGEIFAGGFVVEGGRSDCDISHVGLIAGWP